MLESYLCYIQGVESISSMSLILQGDEKERFNAIQQELSQLSTKFSNNVLDSTKSFKKLVSDVADLEGVPPSAMSLFAQQAKDNGHPDATAEKGPWLLTLVSQPIGTHDAADPSKLSYGGSRHDQACSMLLSSHPYHFRKEAA